MAGYICKILIEDTHPPVWRRVLIPDKITFYDLHQIIQVVFQWEEEHLHDFRIPSDHIVIEDQEGFSTWEESYEEFETTIDPFFERYKWIRYTYDFGDDWRHKINIEKYDPDYHERAVKLLKYKGDNFMEDSGGIWSEEENRFPFDERFVKEQLGLMSFPEYKQEDMHLDDNLIEQYPAFSTLYMTLRALLMSKEQVLDCLDGVIDDIENGNTLDVVIENLRKSSGESWPIDTYVDIWCTISNLMIEVEIPMLEGQNRRQCAEQQKTSEWNIGMLPENIPFKNTKKQHLYEFPPQVQEWMYNADREGMLGDINRLLAYKKENQICSEEYIYLLAMICIDGEYFEEAKNLIQELSESSNEGKDIAEILNEEMEMSKEDTDDTWLDESTHKK